MVSCVGCQPKDRGDQDHSLIFKMNNKRGRKRETDKRGWDVAMSRLEPLLQHTPVLFVHVDPC